MLTNQQAIVFSCGYDHFTLMRFSALFARIKTKEISCYDYVIRGTYLIIGIV